MSRTHGLALFRTLESMYYYKIPEIIIYIILCMCDNQLKVVNEKKLTKDIKISKLVIYKYNYVQV